MSIPNYIRHLYAKYFGILYSLVGKYERWDSYLMSLCFLQADFTLSSDSVVLNTIFTTKATGFSRQFKWQVPIKDCER